MSVGGEPKASPRELAQSMVFPKASPGGNRAFLMSACQETTLLASTGACLSREVGKETIGTQVQIQ